MNQMSSVRPGTTDDGLGPTSDIGAKLRALYSSVQEEGIPSRFLDLLEQLDQVETGGSGDSAKVPADGK